MITCILVDDEQDALDALEWKLTRYCKNIEIKAKIKDPIKAIEEIKVIKPDCLFLDVQMPKLTGFDVLNESEQHSFHTIFTTAHDSYALKALKASAIDYLLKPIDKDDLIAAVDKLTNQLSIPKQPKAITLEKIKILYEGSIHLFEPGEIILLKADRNYTTIHLTESRKILLSKTLKDVEETLPPQVFFRSHNSYVVNINHVKKISKGTNGEIEMSNGNIASLSRSKKEELFNRL